MIDIDSFVLGFLAGGVVFLLAWMVWVVGWGIGISPSSEAIYLGFDDWLVGAG